MTQYYVKDQNKIFGPVEAPKVKLYVSKGFFTTECELSSDRQNWVAASKLMNFSAIIPTVRLAGSDEPATENTGSETLPPVDDFELPPPKRSGSEKKKKHGWGFKIFINVMILLILAGFVAIFYFGWKFLKNENKKAAETAKTPQTFEEVYKKYGNCVGLVTVVLEKDGELLQDEVAGIKISSIIPIGTAFAISENQFATNSHVAHGLKGGKKALMNEIIHAVAEASGVKSDEEFNKFIEAHKKYFEELRKGLKVRSIEVRLSHSNGKRHTVKSIQVHPDYGSQKEVSRNAEFDIAILHVEEKIDNFFPLANTETLHSLSVGQEIAYLGFPMEGLADYGGIDKNSPEAVFKSGRIGKITDFNNKVSGAPEDNKSITHDIPAAGGASGSPIFLKNGEVVAILWGVLHHRIGNQFLASAVQHNKALRIDALENVRTSKVYSWQEWMGE